MTDWDERYRHQAAFRRPRHPHELLLRFWKAIPPGPIVDIAMGTGRDSIFLISSGRISYGMDRSGEALRLATERASDLGLPFSCVQGDANMLAFKKNSCAGVIVFYFLLRHILRDLSDLLLRGGILIYETYLKRQNAVDRPRNPDYLLDDGELYRSLSSLETLWYEERIQSFGDKKRIIAQYAGRKK